MSNITAHIKSLRFVFMLVGHPISDMHPQSRDPQPGIFFSVSACLMLS